MASSGNKKDDDNLAKWRVEKELQGRENAGQTVSRPDWAKSKEDDED